MNKNVIIGAVVVLLAALGYYQFSYAPAQKEAAAMEEAAAAAAAEAEAAAAKVAEEAAAAAKAAEEAAAAAATATTDAATDAAAATTEAATDAMAALDPASFDAAKVVAMIDASALDDATKATLKTAVEGAVADPTLVESVVAQVKTALGM